MQNGIINFVGNTPVLSAQEYAIYVTKVVCRKRKESQYDSKKSDSKGIASFCNKPDNTCIILHKCKCGGKNNSCIGWRDLFVAVL